MVIRSQVTTCTRNDLGVILPPRAKDLKMKKRYCRNCGCQVEVDSSECPSCRSSAYGSDKFCQTCGNATQPGAVWCGICGWSLRDLSPDPSHTSTPELHRTLYRSDMQLQPGTSTPSLGRGNTVDRRKSRITAGVFAILFGGAGLHKFYLGYMGTGLFTLLFATPFAYLGVAALVYGGAYYWSCPFRFASGTW